jgi:hypothetical protein
MLMGKPAILNMKQVESIPLKALSGALWTTNRRAANESPVPSGGPPGAPGHRPPIWGEFVEEH